MDIIHNKKGMWNLLAKSLLFKNSNKLYSIDKVSLFELTSENLNDKFVKYGMNSITEFDSLLTSKNYILQNSVNKDENGLWEQELSRKPLSIKFE